MKFSYLPIAIIGMALSACGPEATSEMAWTETQFDFERACKETVHRYAIRIDKLDGEGLSNLFLEDGFLSIPGLQNPTEQSFKLGLRARKTVA